MDKSADEEMAGRARKPYDFEAFSQSLDVSRETLAALKRYGALLEEWQGKFNLVSPKTIPGMWHRHFLDSVQILDLVDKKRPVWLDFGSGAGFPGMVAAILLQERGGGTVHLVESIGKKCRFLREVVKETIGQDGSVEVIIHQDRLEQMDAFEADVISARAVTSLDKLCGYAHRFQGPETICLFPKGQDVERELTEASKCWNIDLDKYPSTTDPRGVILRLNHLSPKDKKSGRKDSPKHPPKSRQRQR